MSSSVALYVPVHRRTPSAHSPSSSRPLSPASLHAPIPGVYTPAELLALAHSPLVGQSHGVVDALRASVPEVVQSRRQRKALAWHARHPAPTATAMPITGHTHRRASSRGSQSHSESEEERSVSWRSV